MIIFWLLIAYFPNRHSQYSHLRWGLSKECRNPGLDIDLDLIVVVLPLEGPAYSQSTLWTAQVYYCVQCALPIRGGTNSHPQFGYNRTVRPVQPGHTGRSGNAAEFGAEPGWRECRGGNLNFR